ncbi:MAG: hypothetical protein K2H60_11780 [Muribaculaceae bacterium]|nr:hypothetical protein [Muribaculaceae bacterium]
MSQKSIKAVDLLLSKLDKEDLDNFIRKECKNDSQFRDRFLALGAGTVFIPLAENYSARINKLINKYGGRHGYIEYRDTFDFNREVSRILEEAEEAIQNKQWEVAIAILSGIAASGDDILNSGDDSAGELGAIVAHCFELWHDLADSELPENISQEIFSIAMSRFEAGELKGWDWWWDWMEIAIDLADTPEQQNRVIKALDAIKPKDDDWSSNYRAKTAQSYRLKIMAKCGTPEEQLEFMYANVDNPDFRKELIQRAWDEENYAEVLRLAQDGLIHDAQWAGLVFDWHVWEMEVYRQLNDTENTLRLARHFFLERNGWGRGEYSMENMYRLMKSLVPEEKWNDWVNTLLKESEDKREIRRILFIYTQEKMWDKYMNWLRKNATTYNLDAAPQEVKQLDTEEFIRLYEKDVRAYFQRANSRDAYRQGVELLRQLISYGGKEEAETIIEEQKARRPRRPALIEELSKI